MGNRRQLLGEIRRVFTVIGNTFSLQRAIEKLGTQSCLSTSFQFLSPSSVHGSALNVLSDFHTGHQYSTLVVPRGRECQKNRFREGEENLAIALVHTGNC